MYPRGLLVILLLDFASASINLHFLQQFTSHYSFHSSALNIISCDEHETVKLIKMLSSRFQRFVAIRGADRPLNPFSDEPQIFLLDVRCSTSVEILQQADDMGLFGKPFQWLLSKNNLDSDNGNSSENDECSFWPFLETLNILTDSDVKVLEEKSDGKITITGVYKIGNNFIKEPLAEWSSKDGLVFVNIKSVAHRRWNLQGVALPSSLVVTDMGSLMHLEDTVDKHIDTSTKVSYNMVNLFGELLNARLSITNFLYSDHMFIKYRNDVNVFSISYKIETEWGILKNGSWTGMVGDFEKKEIEFGAAPLFIRPARFGILEYYATVNPTRVKFIFLSPPLSYANNIFVMPFDSLVWFSCFAMVAISCSFLFTSLNYERRQSANGNEKTEDSSKVSFSEILVLNIGAICLQGTYANTKKPSSRIITLFLYLSYMFLYISYSAAIVAILQSSDTSVQTLADFLKSPLKAGADDVAYSQYYFKTADDEVRKAIYRTKIAPKGEPPHFLPVEKGVQELRKGFYSYHTEVSGGYFLIQKTFTEDEKCALQELRDNFIQFPEPWLVMRKRTPYAEIFKIGMKMLIERGFKSRFARRFYTEKPICASKSSRFVSVGIIDCYYAFLLLSVGYAAAVVIVVLEVGFKKYSKMREQRKVFNNNDTMPQIEFFN